MSRLHARLRSSRALALAIAVALILASLLTSASLAFAEDRESPRAEPSRSPGATSSLAGNEAGQGRPRPGRTNPATATGASGEVPSSGVGTVSADPTVLMSPSGTSGRPSSRSASPSPTRSAPASAEPHRQQSPSGKPEREQGDPDEGELRDEELLSDDFDASEEGPVPPRTPPHDASAQEQNSQAVAQPVARAVPALTLGVGMALMGLGIGFLGLRLRRH
ncbi:hypothetical protein [Streptomyces sp. NBC_01716]|uniref:hypothetical protein n=1 Tax=Streptomyces sp. NBC_01716 TaxID=2975917 RepID=UPI002E2EE645|nr:hypothetical protein [Streptomyces sp. NBC_01716]